jgi:hypothetical protein
MTISLVGPLSWDAHTHCVFFAFFESNVESNICRDSADGVVDRDTQGPMCVTVLACSRTRLNRFCGLQHPTLIRFTSYVSAEIV